MSISDVTQPRSVKPSKARGLRLPQWVLRAGLVLAIASIELVVVMVALMAGYQALYRERIHRGVTVWGLDLGGSTRAEAQVALIEHFADYTQQPWELQDGGQTWSAAPPALGVRFDPAATVEAAFATGRYHSLAWNLGEQLRSASKGVQVAPVVSYDEVAARNYLEGLSREIFRPVQDAALTIRGTEIYETRPQVGRQLDVEANLAALRQQAGRLGKREIGLVVEETPPRVIDAGIAHKQAASITGAPLTLQVDRGLFGASGATVTGTLEAATEMTDSWQLSQEHLAAMLVVGELPVGDDGSVRLDVTLNLQALSAHVAPIGRVVSRTTTNARFIFNDDTHQLEAISPSTSGLELDVEASVARIAAYALGTEREVPLVMKMIPAEFNETLTAEQLGISELVASSTSYFAGSSAGRRNNVEIAASKFHGILIKPGQTFSFNEWLGEVTEEEGYDESLIIFGNETIPDVGGGICQVSTTAYRTAFWAGFPIAERWAHAYRVGYYEQGGQPVGLDATIYSPDVDFKFVNDSPHHLLIETYVNHNTSALIFKFYSTGSGRIIEMEGPVVTDVIEHGEPVYKEDADLEPGEIKQIEWATDGLTSLITRVIRDAVTGEIIERKEFKSKFRPWNAVYLVGPGTEVPGHDVIRLDEEGKEDPTS